MSGWGSDWNADKSNPWFKTIPEEYKKELTVVETDFRKEYEQQWSEEAAPISKEAWDNLKPLDVPKFLNKKPTHDPYTNPNAHIYYECGCGAILDPGTKSFAQLNNHASEAGWKIRWRADSYVPYCVKCGEEVE